MSAWHLEGKKALVTGGSKGIGRAIVEEFLALGAQVLLTARDEKQVDATLSELKSPAVHALPGDVSRADDRHQLASWIQSHWGRLDILVNNAGINIRKPSADYTPEEITRVLDIDLLGPFELCRTLLPLLRQSQGASIINVSSVAGSYDVNTGAPYGMAKAGLIQLSRNLAVEWASHHIRVNTVSPWFTATPLTEGVFANPQRLEAITSGTPLRRVAQSPEIAAAVAFLAMDKSSYITGQNITIDGGVTSRLL